MKKGIIIALYIILLLAALGLLGYQFLVEKDFDSGDLIKGGVVLLGIFASLAKVLSGGTQRSRRGKAAYQEAYGKLIGTAFSEEPRQEKQLYKALRDFDKGRYPQALKKLEVLRESCQRSAEYFTVDAFLGLCYDRMGQYRKAAEKYLLALRVREHSTVASNLGMCYSELGDHQSAIEAYKRAVRADSKNPYPLNNLAQLFIQTAEYELGLVYAKKALELNSRMPQALNAMAICHAMLGNIEESDQYIRQAVAAGSDAQKLRRFIASLRSAV